MSAEQRPRGAEGTGNIRIGYLAVAISSILFSAKAVFIKICYRYGISPVALMALRTSFSLPFFAGVALFPWFFKSAEPPLPLLKKDLIVIAGLGFLGYYLASVFDMVGLLYVSAGTERLILYVYPGLVVILSAWFFRKRVSPAMLMPLVLSYGGIALSFGGEALKGTGGRPYLGGFLIFISALCYALFLIGQGSLMHRVGPQRFSAYSMLFSSVAVYLQFIIVCPVSALIQPAQVYLMAFLTALFCTVMPVVLLSYGMKRIGAGKAAVVSSVGPVSTFVLAGRMLGESTGLLQAAGLTLVVIGGLKLGMAKKQ